LYLEVLGHSPQAWRILIGRIKGVAIKHFIEHMTKSEINKLLAQARLEEVLKILLHLTEQDAELHQQVLTASANFHDYSKKEHTGQLSHEQISQGKAQTAAALGYFINTIWENNPADKNIPAGLIPMTIEESRPFPKKISYKRIWPAGFMVLTLAAASIWWFLLRETPPTLQAITVNLHGNGGIMDNPLKEGILKIEAVDFPLIRQATVGSDGRAIFDSIPAEMQGRKVVCYLNPGLQYQLKEPQKEYLFTKKINVQIKPKDSPLNPPPLVNKFQGNWQNINSESHSTYILEITKNGTSAMVRVRSRCCQLTHASPNSMSTNRLTLADFDFYNNHYSNFSIEIMDKNSLLCTYTARIENGQVFLARDTMRRQ
jgi:Effector-associated domain 11